MAKKIAVENFGDCVFCHQPISDADDKTPYGHDFWTKKQAYAHWDCYHEALNARIDAIETDGGSDDG